MNSDQDPDPTRSAEPGAWQPELPPRARTQSGDIRRVGVEIEMIGPTVTEIAEVVAGVLDARAELVTRDEVEVKTDDGAVWRIELDYEYLKRRSRRESDGDEAPSVVASLVDDVVRAGAEIVVPVEVVSPPLPIPRLGVVEEIVGELRAYGVKGTRSGITYAFGMQLNPELPSLDAATVLAYVRSFVVLYDWLVRESRVDLTRKLTGYAASFPLEYVRRVVARDYDPDLAGLIEDYLAWNPTRNRALDLLPLFTELDEARVRRAVDDPRVKARPTFHYRLPNSEIDEPGWGLHVAWANWLEVEHLAEDAERLEGACAAYTAFLDRGIERWFGDWAEEVEPWLAHPDR